MATARKIAALLLALSALPAVAAGSGGGVAPGVPITSSGIYRTVPVTTDTSVLSAATARIFLDIKNEDARYNVTITLGSATFTIAPGWNKTWEGGYVPADAVMATSANPSGSNLTVGSQ